MLSQVELQREPEPEVFYPTPRAVQRSFIVVWTLWTIVFSLFAGVLVVMTVMMLAQSGGFPSATGGIARQWGVLIGVVGMLLLYKYLMMAFFLWINGTRILGKLYLYPDRLQWALWRWSKCLYFSGGEEVKAGMGYLVLRNQGTRIWIPFVAPELPRLHGLLCERSAAYRESQEVRLPWEAPLVSRWVVGLIWPAVVLMGIVLGAAIGMPEMSVVTLAICGAVIALPFILMLGMPMGYRFDMDSITVRRAFGERRYLIAELRDIARAGKGDLRLTFQQGRVLLRQPLVRYPLSVLEGDLRRLYGLEAQ